MENVQNAPYATSYAASIPAEYAGYYSADIDVASLPSNPTNIQKIIVKIYHGEVVTGEEVIILEDYKVNL